MAESNGIKLHVPIMIHIGRGLTYTHAYRYAKGKLNRTAHKKQVYLSMKVKLGF